MPTDHDHTWQFSPLTIPPMPLYFQPAYDAGFVTHAALRPSEPDSPLFTVDATCACGERLIYGPFRLKELQCYLLPSEDRFR